MRDNTTDRKASIIILNWNGKDLLVDCLSSIIEAVVFDGRKHEIIVVDNGSTDGSAEFVRSKFPMVNLLSLKENKRFAIANNIAAQESKNDILIFINNDVVVDKGFIGPLLRHFDNDDIFAITPKIIMQTRWESGFKIKETGLTKGLFKRGFLHVWQEDIDIDGNVPILYASGSAMACDKKKFFQLRGFDVLYNPFYYEDTDISYRAWKRGCKVIYEPQSIVYHKYRTTNNSYNFPPNFINRALQKNQILFVWKNITNFRYLSQHFFFLGMRLLRAFLFLDIQYIFSFLCAFNQLPEVIIRRVRESKNSIVRDKEILKLIKKDMHSLNNEVKDKKGDRKTRVLVLGNAPLPFENQRKIYGSNIRTWNMVKPLWRDGHEIILIGSRIKSTYQNEITLPKIIELRQPSLTFYAVEEHLFNDIKFLQSIHDEFQPDCIIGVNTQPASKAVALKTDKPIWADLNGSIMAEAQAKAYVYDDNTYLNDFWYYENAVLKRADVFSVVSLPQKFALIGELATLGRLNKFTFGHELINYIPNSIDDIEYQHKRKVIRGNLVQDEDFVVLWSGSYNTWTDLDTLFMALEAAMQRNPKIKFVSIGGPVVGHDEKTYNKFLNKISSSKFSGRFIFNEWVPIKDVPNYYFESDVGINIDKFNYETLLGARTRILDMLKAGLPVLTSLGTEISYLIEKEKLGFVYPLGDREELTRIILFLAENRKLLREYGQRAKEYVFRNLTSDKVTLSLREWVKAPKPAPDRGKSIVLYEYYKNPSRSKFEKYIDYIGIESFATANKRALNFLIKRIKNII